MFGLDRLTLQVFPTLGLNLMFRLHRVCIGLIVWLQQILAVFQLYRGVTEQNSVLLFRGRLIIATIFAFIVHFTLTYSINNRAMNHVVDASSSSWLQEHMTDMSER